MRPLPLSVGRPTPTLVCVARSQHFLYPRSQRSRSRPDPVTDQRGSGGRVRPHGPHPSTLSHLTPWHRSTATRASRSRRRAISGLLATAQASRSPAAARCAPRIASATSRALPFILPRSLPSTCGRSPASHRRKASPGPPAFPAGGPRPSEDLWQTEGVGE